MACQLLHSAAIIICKMPQNAIAQIGLNSVAIDTMRWFNIETVISRKVEVLERRFFQAG